jgi:hypothetical protein
MKRFGAPLLGLLATAALIIGPANAGGWWSSIGLEGQPVGIGESINLRVSEVMFDSMPEADRAHDRTFYAYLVRTFDQAALEDAMSRPDPGDWWQPTSEPVRVGTVELIDWDSNLARARVSFRVPQIAEGNYYFMLCDLGCEVALGNLIPSKVSVTSDVLAAQTTRRLQKLEADLTLALQRSRSEVREISRSLRRAVSNDEEQTERIQALERQLTDAREPEPSPWPAYAGWLLAGVSLTFILVQARRRTRSDLEPLMERVPDDARELLEPRR